MTQHVSRIHHEDGEPALQARCESFARGLALTVALLGIAVLGGWTVDVSALKSLRPDWVPMTPDTAVGFVIAGSSLWAASRSHSASRWRALHVATAWMVTLLGLFSLFEYLRAAGFDAGVLATALRSSESADMLRMQRMALATAAGFTLTGCALLSLDSHQNRTASQTPALAGTLIGALALLGYAYGVAALYRVGFYSGMALHTAAGLVAANLGILLARPRRGLIGLMTSRTAGGVLSRRLLPVAILGPFVIGWLSLQGERHALFGPPFGTALISLSYVVLIASLSWRTAAVLRHSDRLRAVAERDRLRQQAQLGGIIASAMDAIVMIDAAQRIVLFNPAAERMFGREAADVVGRPLAILWPQHAESHRAIVKEAFGRTAASGPDTGWPLAATALRANGEEFPIEAAISRLDLDGERYLTAILRDVTERQRMEENLRISEQRERARSEELSRLLDAVPAAVAFAHDSEAHSITGNRLAYRWVDAPEGVNLSLSASAEQRVCDYHVFKDGVELGPDELPLQRATAGFAVHDCELSLRRADGVSRYVLGNATPLFDESGKVRGAISAFIDITARREAEAALRAAKAEAERANEAKSRFLAAASHDLRQPLSALGIYVGLLEGRATAAGEPLLAKIDGCIASLNELLTDLLDLSKLEAGAVTPKPVCFAIGGLLADLVSVHSGKAHDKGLRLHYVASRATACTDLLLFKRILANFLDNAIRYTARGGVVIGCRRRAGKIWVEVWDSGIGIAADKTAEIFEEFTQLGDEGRTYGSGLGLAIAAKTAALLGLEIDVRSRPGRGSVFAVEVPPGTAVPGVEANRARAPSRALTIALVEDNQTVRDALVTALESAGHRVIDAASGAELQSTLGALRPDIVVSDYRLAHGETGTDVVAALRAAIAADLPAILITGDTDPKVMREMSERGIPVLHKPVAFATLQAWLEELTARDDEAQRPCSVDPAADAA